MFTAAQHSLVAISQILLMQNLESDILESGAARVDAAHLGNAISNLDTVGNFLVVRLACVPRVGHAPLVDTEL